jgi:hypothetical protein
MTVVAAENLLIHIGVKVERLDRNVCAVQRALEARPEVLNALSVGVFHR